MNHSEIPEQEVARYWDDNANVWADHVRSGWDAYGEHFNNPAFFAFVGDLSGKTVLEAGCGEGYNTRLLAKSGARTTGVSTDLSTAPTAEETNPCQILQRPTHLRPDSYRGRVLALEPDYAA